MRILHATCVALDGKGVLLRGPSGSGKSDLALRLIDRGATLVADDLVAVEADGGGITASLPATGESWRGMLEVRGVGLLKMPHQRQAGLDLVVDLAGEAQRLPEPLFCEIEGLQLRSIVLNAFDSSAPLKIAAVLTRPGADL